MLWLTSALVSSRIPLLWAVFVSASAMLVDACGGSPSSGATVLAANQLGPFGIAVDDRNVYWINLNAVGGIYSVPKTGGEVTVLATGSPTSGESFALATDTVYFSMDDSIGSVPIGGGATTTLAPETHAGSLTSSGGTLFWSGVEQSAAPAKEVPMLYSMAVTGGQVTTVDLPTSSFSAFDTYETSVIRSAPDAIYAGFTRGVFRIPVSGDTPTYADANAAVFNFAIDDTNLYITTGPTLIAIPKTGEAITTLAYGTNLHGVAVDDSFLYFTDDTPTGRVEKVPKTGGKPTVLASSQNMPVDIAVDANSVYWTCANEGTIKKTPK